MNAQTSMHTIMAYRTILNFSENGEEVAPFGKILNPHNPFWEQDWEVDSGVVIHWSEEAHSTKDALFIHCSNPLKLAVLLIISIIKIEREFSNVKS